MFGGQLSGPEIGPGGQGVRHCGQLFLEPGGQNGQAHHLDQADILLFDVVELPVGVIDSQGVLLGGNVVAQHQVQLVSFAPPPGDGGYGVVRLAAGLGEDKGLLVGIAPPCGEDFVRQLNEPLRVFGGYPHH